MGHATEGGGQTLSTAFRRARRGGVSASFHTVEVELLRSLVGQLLELVREQPVGKQSDESAWAAELGLNDDEFSRPTDPVVLRLFPDGYRDDDNAAADFRRYTERGLRDQKAGYAATVLASLATAEQADPDPEALGSNDKIRVDLDAEAANAWLRTFTDLRLALGTRLGVSEDNQDEWDALTEDDPRKQIHDVYDWLGWVQETLIRALSATLG